MRVWSAALAALCLSAGLGFAALEGVEAQQSGARGPAGRDSCGWAFDGECDEPGIGTGVCAVGTDFSDCRFLRLGETDMCEHARDGECDDPGIGTGACHPGTDRTDCAPFAALRGQNDTCAHAFDGVCDAAPRCAPKTDRRDCLGAERPAYIMDHFFGRDDRIFVNRAEQPWAPIGQLQRDGRGTCTATLIGPDILITAAHCVVGPNGFNAVGRFLLTDGRAANIIRVHVDRRYNYRKSGEGTVLDPYDWALLQIDQPFGDVVGFHKVSDLTGRGEDAARAASLFQAGFSWDTGDVNLSGNVGCHITTVYPDHTFAHECDTTQGDSGSPFMIVDGDGYSIIGVDSNFRPNTDGPYLYIAVGAANFQPYIDDFIANRIGRAVPLMPGATSPSAAQ